MSHKQLGLSILTVFLLTLGADATASTLDQVRQSGKLRCGVNGSLPGLSLRQSDGKWSGLDVDICRAVAAATLGDADKVDFVPLDNQQRLGALAGKQVDLLARNTTWTLHRDTEEGMRFVGVSYYDGQGLMVPKSKGWHSVLELDGASVCVQADTTSVDNIKRHFMLNRMKVKLVTVENADAQRMAYEEGQCDVITGDQSQLYSLRTELKEPSAHRILPEVISKEPLSPAVRADDPQWHAIVRWTLFALIDAEELGISSVNVERARTKAKNPVILSFLGAEGNAGAGMGLEADWAYDAIRQVGNYAEIFERNLGPLGIKRGLNALWRNGGLMYAPPIR
jgi:general L-amino acid transport system substrate-binding protein